MEMEFGVTVSYFLWSLVLGGALALIYDLLRMTRRIIATSVFGVNLEDICFFLLGGLLLFFTAYDKNGGQLRFQGFIGVLLGFTLYRRILKERLVNALVLVYETILRVSLWLLKILLFPVSVIYKILAKPFLVVIWYSKERARRMNGFFRSAREQKKIRKKCKETEMKKRKKQRKIAVDKGKKLGYN